MKRLSVVCKFCLLAVAWNAAAADSQPPQTGQPLRLFVQAPSDILSVTHGEQVKIGQFPADIPTLKDTPIADTLVLTASVRDSEGKRVGISSELEAFPPNDPEHKKPWQTWWTIVLPGRGALLAYQTEKIHQGAAAAFSAPARTGKDWQGSVTEQNTTGPNPDGSGVIVGGTGEFEGAQGRFIEIGTLERVTVDGRMEAELELRFYLEKTE